MRFIVFFVLILPLSARAEGKALELTDASGGDCGLNYLVYSKLYDKRFRDGGLSNATAFVNDLCDMAERVRIGINGEVIELQHRSGKVRDDPKGMRLFYTSDNSSLSLSFKELIYRKKDLELQCTTKWYRVVATVQHGALKRTVNGSIDWGDCP